MKTVAMILALLVPAVLAADFEAWKAATGTTFHTIEEEAARRAIFNANVARINEHNAKDLGWTMGLNDFAAMTSDEFASAYIGGWKGPSRRVPSYDGKHLLANKVNLPTSVDWVKKGAVTGVKNQGQCGSCWAFSTTGSVEGITAIKTGTLVSLSEQQLVDCSGAEGNMGCNGGLMDNAFKYIIQNGGICSESSYPYQGVQGTCQSSSCKSAATISGYTDVQPKSETALMSAIAQQPVSIAVQANQMSFQFYSGGVMTSSCGDQLDHGVLAVGYGATGGQDYWQVKNSWGPSWGANGYILLGRGGSYGNGGAGQCGLMTTPSYPTKN